MDDQQNQSLVTFKSGTRIMDHVKVQIFLEIGKFSVTFFSPTLVIKCDPRPGEVPDLSRSTF